MGTEAGIASLDALDEVEGMDAPGSQGLVGGTATAAPEAFDVTACWSAALQRERVGARSVHGGEYIGLDWRPGPGVDVVSLVHEYQPGRRFDTVS